MVHDHLLRMPISECADHENVTGANKLASPRRVIRQWHPHYLHP